VQYTEQQIQTDRERAQDPASIKRQKELQDYWGKRGREVTRLPFGTGKGGGELFGLEGRPTPTFDEPIPTGMQESGLNITQNEDGSYTLYQPGGDSAPEGSGITTTNADPSYLRALLGLSDTRYRYGDYAVGPPPEIPEEIYRQPSVSTDPLSDLLATLFPSLEASAMSGLEGLNITDEVFNIFADPNALKQELFAGAPQNFRFDALDSLLSSQSESPTLGFNPSRKTGRSPLITDR
jgi:hypothetical protein